jgi:hypothetical protein
VWLERVQAIEEAPVDVIDAVLDLLEEPEALGKVDDPMDLQLAFADVLTRWGKRNVDAMRRRIVERILRPQSRQVMFLVLQDLKVPGGTEIVRPAVEHADAMSEEEQVDLASAVWLSDGPNRRELLQEMARHVPERNLRAKHEIRDALLWLDEHGE